MKKTLTALSAAALILAASGCSDASTDSGPSPSSGASSAATGSSASATAPATAGTGPAAPSPSGTPSSASTDALAEGFPVDLIPLMEGAHLLSSAVDRKGSLLTATLVASSEAPPAQILEFYGSRLKGQGFAEAEAAADSATTASRDYLRTGAAEPETVNVTVVTKEGGSPTVTVGASLLAESEK